MKKHITNIIIILLIAFIVSVIANLVRHIAFKQTSIDKLTYEMQDKKMIALAEKLIPKQDTYIPPRIEYSDDKTQPQHRELIDTKTNEAYMINKRDSMFDHLRNLHLNINYSNEPKKKSYIIYNEYTQVDFNEENTDEDNINCAYRVHKKVVAQICFVAKQDGYTSSKHIKKIIEDEGLADIDEEVVYGGYLARYDVNNIYIDETLPEDVKFAYLYISYRYLTKNPVGEYGLVPNRKELELYKKLKEKYEYFDNE